MTEAKKPRVFMLHLLDGYFIEQDNGGDFGKNVIRTVEYSALQNLIDENAKLVEKLKKAEEVIKRLSAVKFPIKPCSGNEISQVMLEENCAIASAYLKEQV